MSLDTWLSFEWTEMSFWLSSVSISQAEIGQKLVWVFCQCHWVCRCYCCSMLMQMGICQSCHYNNEIWHPQLSNVKFIYNCEAAVSFNSVKLSMFELKCIQPILMSFLTLLFVLSSFMQNILKYIQTDEKPSHERSPLWPSVIQYKMFYRPHGSQMKQQYLNFLGIDPICGHCK